MGATSHMDGQAVIDRARMLRGAARLTGARVAGARARLNRSPSLRLVDDAGRTRARVGLVVQSDGFVLVEVVGAVDIAAREELADVLGRAVDSGAPAVIVDLSGVTLLAAAGSTV